MSPTADSGTVLAAHHQVVTRADVVAYAAASGDLNPIHWSDRHALAAGLPGVVAHGMLTLGVAARAIEEWCGPDVPVRELRAAFVRPVVVPDDDLGVEIVVTGELVVAADGARKVRLRASAAGVTVLARASALVGAAPDGSGTADGVPG